MVNEKPSKKVAAIAGRISRDLASAKEKGCVFLFSSDGRTIKVSDVQTLAASALTQAPDRSANSFANSYLTRRLSDIAEIIEAVDTRCAAADGPVTPTLNEIRGSELRKIYRLAKGKK